MRKYKIAGKVVELDYSDDLIYRDFSLFECDCEEPTQIYWSLVDGVCTEDLSNLSWKEMDGFRFAHYGDKTYVHYTENYLPIIKLIVYENKYTKATYYTEPNWSLSCIADGLEEFSEYLFVFHQEAFFLAMLQNEFISVHSSTLVYRNRGIVFSAQSGTGKTTHTNMWNELYQTPILDGDVTLCNVVDGYAQIYGLPWAGTSDAFMNETVRLGAIVFLEQGTENKVERLGYFDAFQRLLARSFSPLWVEEFFQKCVRAVEAILNLKIPCFVLSCKPDFDAVNTIKKEIDESFDEREKGV